MSTNDVASRLLPVLALAATAGVALRLVTTSGSEKQIINGIKANLKDGFCGQNEILISRLPLAGSNMGSCGTLLGLFHEHDAQVTVHEDCLVSSKKSWKAVKGGLNHSRTLLSMNMLSRGAQAQKLRSADGSYEYNTMLGHADGTYATYIDRATLMTLLILSNARTIYEFSDSNGYRGAFGSWTGQWYINWRAGQPAIVTLKPHDSHSPATDVYAPTFPARVDRCVQMMAGIVVDATAPQSFSVAFPGRLTPGNYRLECQESGFGLSHGSRHIYNMNGGKVFEIDFLFPRPIEENHDDKEDVYLKLPSSREDGFVGLEVPLKEYRMLEEALDKLPWANLSWSMHRGMRDLLLGCARDRMNQHRITLAQILRDAAKEYHMQLVQRGWNSNFAKCQMGNMAANAVLAGRGNSGDAVRIVTALAEQIHGGTTQQRDTTTFWRSGGPQQETRLEPDEIIALVKCFVLEWSQDFNYQMYHQLPITLLFG